MNTFPVVLLSILAPFCAGPLNSPGACAFLLLSAAVLQVSLHGLIALLLLLACVPLPVLAPFHFLLELFEKTSSCM